MVSKIKVLVLIDGFNYYYKLKNYQYNNKICVKWLDYKSMVYDAVKSYKKLDDFELEVIYFSALAEHRSSEALKRNKIYINALLLSEDNDYVPVVKRVKQLFPSKTITICPPPQKHYAVDALLRASWENDAYRFKWNQIKRFQFPDDYQGLVNPWVVS